MFNKYSKVKAFFINFLKNKNNKPKRPSKSTGFKFTLQFLFKRYGIHLVFVALLISTIGGALNVVRYLEVQERKTLADTAAQSSANTAESNSSVSSMLNSGSQQQTSSILSSLSQYSSVLSSVSSACSSNSTISSLSAISSQSSSLKSSSL